MIRPARSNEADAIVSIAHRAGLFEPDEAEHLRNTLDEFFAGQPSDDKHWLIAEDEGAAVGVAYCAREEMTRGTWNLYLLAVHPDRQGAGQGSGLVRRVEELLSQAGQRVLLIETSSLPEFARTRAFYERLGYSEEARVRDFYDAGDDKVVFRKVLHR